MLRIAWGRARRSVPHNLAGWGLLAAAAGFGWAAGGAWGVAVAALFAMGLALALLALAAWRSPPGRRVASNRRAGMLPDSGRPLGLWRRIATFLLGVLGAFAGAVALAVTLQLAARAAGAAEADANALALFAQPLIWALLAYGVLMARSRARQVALLAASGIPLLPLLLLGGAR